jgi:hypothetical protein
VKTRLKVYGFVNAFGSSMVNSTFKWPRSVTVRVGFPELDDHFRPLHDLVGPGIDPHGSVGKTDALGTAPAIRNRSIPIRPARTVIEMPLL